MTYYKAVRPDGTDFATGTTRPVIGEWMPSIEGELEICARGYHVSTKPAETLVGGSWPCRLFEVEAKGISRQRDNNKHKRVCRTYRPIRELPAWMALGPNGEAVAALIEQCRALTPEQAAQLAAAGTAAGAAVWAAVGDAVWAAVGASARAAAGTVARAAMWAAGGDAGGAAAWALIVRDLITPEQFDLLYGPWASVMEVQND